MKLQNYKKAQKLVQDIAEKKAELEMVEHLLSNISGETVRVRINSQWTVNLPIEALIEHATTRKGSVEREIASLESELDGL